MGSGDLSKDKKKSKKKEHKKRHDDSEDDSHHHRRKRKSSKKEKEKRKFKKPKRKTPSASELSSDDEYAKIEEVLRTPPRHQKLKRMLHRQKLKTIDSDVFLPLREFAYDRSEIVKQAFTTLRKGFIERACPDELQHLSLNELQDKLISLASTMSKERLRSYIEDRDLSHTSDEYEPDTPTEDEAEDEVEGVNEESPAKEEDVVTALMRTECEAKERELRERLTRKFVERIGGAPTANFPLTASDALNPIDAALLPLVSSTFPSATTTISIPPIEAKPSPSTPVDLSTIPIPAPDLDSVEQKITLPE